MSSKSIVILASNNISRHDNLIRSIKAQNISLHIESAESTELELNILKKEPTVVVFDAQDRPYAETERLIRNLNFLKDLPLTLVINPYKDDLQQQKLEFIGNTRCIDVPYLASSLTRLIKQYIDSIPIDEAALTVEIYQSINSVLSVLGFHSGMQGFLYIRKAVFMYAADTDGKLNLSKHIYPQIADKYDTNPKAVEWAIRSAIGTAWKRTDRNIRAMFFSESIADSDNKPTNKDFIRTIGRYIHDNCADIIYKLSESSADK